MAEVVSSHSRQATPCCSPTSLLDFGSLSLTTFICIYNSHRQLPPLKKWALKCIQLTSQNSHHQAASTEFISKENQERIVKFVFRLLATFWCLCHIQVPSLRKQASKQALCSLQSLWKRLFVAKREFHKIRAAEWHGSNQLQHWMQLASIWLQAFPLNKSQRRCFDLTSKVVSIFSG